MHNVKNEPNEIWTFYKKANEFDGLLDDHTNDTEEDWKQYRYNSMGLGHRNSAQTG